MRWNSPCIQYLVSVLHESLDWGTHLAENFIFAVAEVHPHIEAGRHDLADGTSSHVRYDSSLFCFEGHNVVESKSILSDVLILRLR